MSTHQSPDERLKTLLDDQRRINGEIAVAMREIVTNTSAATTVAGYETLNARLQQFIDAGGVGFETLQALYTEQQAHISALQQDVRSLIEERRAAGADIAAQLTATQQALDAYGRDLEEHQRREEDGYKQLAGEVAALRAEIRAALGGDAERAA